MALEKITMPQLGESVTEGTVNNWLVKEGDEVNKYDPIVEVLTDKVNAEVPSSFTGKIKELVVKEGETIAVGEVICTIEVAQTNNKSTELSASEETISDIKNDANQESMKKRYSPAVLRLAQEKDIDLEQITGSGRGGRITRKDIEKVIQNGGIIQKGDTSQQKSTITSAPLNTSQKINEGDIEIPVTGIRKTIAQNMLRSKHEIPHAWMTIEVDVTDLVHYRNKIKNDFQEKEGFNLTYFPFFVKAISDALKKYPQINSTWQNDKIIQRKDINLSIAVAVEEELFVPVIKNADEKSVKGIAKNIHDLAKKARNHNLSVNDMEGGTFTINNTGIFGSVQSMGIINYPQSAILQVESIVKRPVIINNMFAARDMVNLCLSLDHRILDGLVCGKFLAFIKERLENMNEDNINIY
ncbi:dihydrolipoamide acetyltransferase family protein [Oceanobacillus sp. Castelsardo]|uniref:dihydrolipoamide acetyltransferase family protein n=1 Tax=Oceanobacillus sp. Castelsardo TaxID=1851204 RepID=UPI000838E6EE|nr:dihydrolipoamide acetyltransferase family protein [Oceanobacillus sp. Castelsardo]